MGLKCSIWLLAAVLCLGGCASLQTEERPSAAPAAAAMELQQQQAAKELAEREAQISRLKEEMAGQQAAMAQAQQQVLQLGRAVEELSAQVKRLEEARERQHPLREQEVKQPAKAAEKRRETAKKEAITDELGRIKQELRSRQAARKPQGEPRRNLAKKKPEQGGPAGSARDVALPEDLASQLKLLEETAQKDAAKEQATETKPAAGGTPPEETQPAEAKKAPQPAKVKPLAARQLKVKVLSGDGRKESARAMAARLRKMGYRVDLTDRAERSDFEGITVYYSSGNGNVAESLAKRLGPDTKTKPLSWSSAFDLIVVTGRPAR